MERWTKKAVELGVRMALLNETVPSVTEYKPSKTEIPPVASACMTRVSPESVGVCSGRISCMLKDLEALGDSTRIHNVVIAREGKIISSSSRLGYSTDIPHLSHSMSKVLTSIAIGYLVTDGKLGLDDPIVGFFPELTPSDKQFADITVRHLLSMTSGVKFSEIGVVAESEWTKCFFEGELRTAPGEMFSYNSMNTYLLAVIAKRVSGKGVSDILKERLFLPLGITDFFWEYGPEGVEKGGFGAYMSLESWAKIGLVFADGGRFSGKTVIPEEWIKETLSVQAVSPKEKGGYDYGYTVWTSPEHGACLFSGMLGQMVYISLVNKLVVAINGGNDELFFTEGSLGVIEKYFGDPLPDISSDEYCKFEIPLIECERDFLKSKQWAVPLERKKGILYRIGLKYREPYPEDFNSLLGRFSLPMNNTSIIPIFVRVMQNNYPSSLEEIGFLREGRRIFLVCRDGGNDYKIEVGFYRHIESVIDVSGEKYRVRALASVDKEDDRTVYKIELVYPELPNVRRITLKRAGRDVIDVNLSELPGEGLIDYYLNETLAANPRMSFLTDMLEGRLGKGYIGRKAHLIFNYGIGAVRRGTINYEELMDRERERAPRTTDEERSVASMVLRFVGAGDKKEGGFFGDLLLGALARLGGFGK